MKTVNNNQEQWKPVEGFPKYQVSNFGRVRSPYGIKKPDKSGQYYRVHLCNEGECRKFSVHRLVAKAFIDNPHNYSQVNHIDGNKTNNRVENLEWCTPAQNTYHAIAHGMRKGLLPNEKKEIRKLYRDGATRKELARKFNISASVVGDHVKGIRKLKYLSKAEKDEIKKLYRTGNYSKRKLGRMFGVCHKTIMNILNT